MTYYKYSRTMHLPWSPGTQSDDRLLKNIDHLLGKEGVATLKRDGENTSLYTDHSHARSLDSQHHDSRNWVKAFHGTIAHEIPPGWRICGENLYAKHSIHYLDLETYFEAFSVWDDKNMRLQWDEQKLFLTLLGVKQVPELWRGTITREALAEIERNIDTTAQEGYVVTTVEGFHYKDFGKHVAKWVRPKHVQTDKHWMTQAIVPNKLRS